MPFVRGKFIPEIESVGRAKRHLDVLFWLKNPEDPQVLKMVDELEHLRIYLAALEPQVASIRVLIPFGDKKSRAALTANGIAHDVVPKSERINKVPQAIRELPGGELAAIAAMTLTYDIDCVVTDRSEYLPYIEEFGEIGVFLTTVETIFLHYCEVFVRGHDVPWSFSYKVWFYPWTTFYQFAEQATFKLGMELLHLAANKGTSQTAQEAGRSLVFNRLGDICFTRDRLLFYEIQKAVSKRAGWKRQRFATEIAYHLNFYYLSLFGTFDHAAVFVNALLNLGLKEKRISARNQEFLTALKSKSPKMHAVFDNKYHKSFIAKVAAIRHVAAHRGVVTPAKVVEQPDQEPTNDELDEDIRQAGWEDILLALPAGENREKLRATMRTNARAARYGRKTLMEDVLLIQVDGSWGFIDPLLDTAWNFHRCMDFLEDVFGQCTAEIS
jgi:hypothetical protein